MAFASPAYENKRSKREWHHIVAKGARNATRAKAKLTAVGINVNDDVNLIWLQTGLHRRIHTDLYYGWANSVVISAYNSARGNDALERTRVLEALMVLRTFLGTLNETAPF